MATRIVYWDELPVDSEEHIDIPAELIDYIAQLNPSKRGNWSEYLYSQYNPHEANTALLEGFPIDGTYEGDRTLITKAGVIPWTSL